jgi:hypothetical protein
VTMAFDVDMSIAATDMSMGLELYFWPAGNAAVTVSVFGGQDDISGEEVQAVLNAVEKNLAEAAG